ncbi:hypothetical protein [Streptomyces sp. D54]
MARSASREGKVKAWVLARTNKLTELRDVDAGPRWGGRGREQ